jgi:hypothetical protein
MVPATTMCTRYPQVTAVIKGQWLRSKINQCREVKLGMIKSRVMGGVSGR